MQYCNVICSQIKKENKMVESNLRFIKHFSERENFSNNAETEIKSQPRFISKLEKRLYMPILCTFPLHASYAKDHL